MYKPDSWDSMTRAQQVMACYDNAADHSYGKDMLAAALPDGFEMQGGFNITGPNNDIFPITDHVRERKAFKHIMETACKDLEPTEFNEYYVFAVDGSKQESDFLRRLIDDGGRRSSEAFMRR